MTIPLPHRAAFGCMQFGGRADDAASRAMFDACLDAGITHFDTAFGYTDGASETLLGRFAAPLGDRLFVATKAGYSGGAGRANLLAQFDTSRKRLRMDSVDLLYIHRYDPDTPLAETIETLARLQSDGKIRQIGLSNFAAWQVMKAQSIAAAFGTRIDAIQPMYSVVKRQAQVELLPLCADQSIAVYSYSPLGGGLLSGKYAAGQTGRLSEDARYAARYGQPEMHRAATNLANIAQETGIPSATLAVAWVMRRGVCPILSARNADQLVPSLAALTYLLDDALDARLTALVPNPPPATDRLEEA